MNPYRPYTKSFFEKITEIQFTGIQLKSIFSKENKKYKTAETIFPSYTGLLIRDWTGEHFKLPRVSMKIVNKDNYEDEMAKILSREYGLLIAQCYEALEKALKDIIWEKGSKNFSPSEYLEINRKKYFRGGGAISRETLKGGDHLFNLMRELGGERFKKYSNNNYHGIQFKPLFMVFNEIRHAATHSNGKTNHKKIPNNQLYAKIMDRLFLRYRSEGNAIIFDFDYFSFMGISNRIAEFVFQIFKIYSEQDGFDFKITV